MPVVVHEGVAYSAETERRPEGPPAVRTTARASNATAARVDVTFPDGCVVLIRAYRAPERGAPPAWDQARAVACPEVLMEVPLAPGQTREFHSTATAREILGDSLPDGRYYFTALIRPGGQPIEVSAGSAELRRAPE